MTGRWLGIVVTGLLALKPGRTIRAGARWRQQTARVVMTWLAGASIAVAATDPAPTFTGDASYITLGTPAALQTPTGSPLTIEGWMYVDEFSGTNMLFSKFSGGTHTYMFGVRTSGTLLSANTGFGVNAGRVWRDATLPSAMDTNRWYHVAFSLSGTTMSYYLDGVLVGTAPYYYGNFTAHTIRLGGYTDTTGIKGRKRDVRLWKHARTEADIRAYMNRRLTGQETGLLGYWPLDEGAGDAIFDAAPGSSNGVLTNGDWIADAGLVLAAAPSDFEYSPAMTLADSVTGSTRVTNDGTVDLAEVPVPVGYTHFQLTTSDDPGSLGGTWTGTNEVPATYTFASPAGDTNLRLYAWFTNTAESVSLQLAPGSIYYTTEGPQPAIHHPLALYRGAGHTVVITPEMLDNGSTGGSADGTAMAVHSRHLTLVSGDDTDATPGDPWITVGQAGSYVIEMTVTNEAGNVAVSSPSTVTITNYTDTMTWSGTNEWFTPEHWTPIGLPVAGVKAAQSNGTLRLRHATPPLGSFILSGGTLEMLAWESALVADSVTISGGTLNHPLQTALLPVLGEWIPDSRVRIVCSNFVLNTTIDLAARGFRNGQGFNLDGKGPGGGKEGGGGKGGGGYGGRGGDNSTGYGGAVYGSVQAPELWPGSGGGDREQHAGGHGGGLFVLEADGHVVLNGTINVNGAHRLSNERWGGGGGSGGGVLIRARTLAATNAVITANGGNGGRFRSGSGGGGRIAIDITDSDAQDNLPGVEIALQTQFGPQSGNDDGVIDSRLGDYGAIWVNHDSLLPAAISGIYGFVHGPNVKNVSRSSFALTNSWLRLVGNETFDVTGDVTLSGASLLELRATDIGGDIVMANASTMSFYGIPTNGLPNHLTTRVAVHGEFHIGANGTVFFHSDPETGGSPYLEVDRLYLADTATMNADQRGYGGGQITVGGYGPGTTTDGYGGASHGGLGGRHPTYGGTTYGSVTEPAEPGSGGAGRSAGIGRTGGGLIHITAADTMALHGTVTANGGAAASNIGASSGGAIYLWADIFLPAEGTISAVGGAGTGSGSAALGGGGGGRIARLFRGDGFTGNRLRAGGANEFPGIEGSLHEGYYDDFVTLTIEGDPARRGQPTPLEYGNHGVIEGSVVNSSVTSPTVGVDGVRYRCLGWHFEDANGVTDSGTGTAFSGTINTNATLTWFWTNEYYLATSAAVGGSLQTDRTGWYTEGETPSLTPVADSGRTFTQWAGDYAPASLTTVPLPILMDAPRTIRANFGVVGGTAKTWAGGTGDWMNPDGWAPAGVPAPDDTVAITNGAVTLNVEILGIAALTVRAPGTLTVIDTDLSVAGSMVLDGSGLRATFTRSDLTIGGHLELMNAGDLRVNSGLAPVGYYGTKVEVKGNLTIGTGSWIFPHSALYENGSVLFPVGNLYVDSGGGFNADHRGYRGGLAPQDGGPTVGWGPGMGNIARGGGYGGIGGGASGQYGQIYGTAEQPFEPGSGGGGDGGNPWRGGGNGGGLIWVQSDHIIRLDGTMTANGQIGQGDSATGGGSGGGIYLRCRRFEGSGILRANGGSGHGGTTGTSGGGGRIAVWRTSHTFTGPEPSVSVGTPPGSPPAGEGTVFWGDIPPPGKLFIIR